MAQNQIHAKAKNSLRANFMLISKYYWSGMFHKRFSERYFQISQWIWKIGIIYPHFIDNANEYNETACPKTCWINIVLFNPFSSRLPYTTSLYSLDCKVLVRKKIFSPGHFWKFDQFLCWSLCLLLKAIHVRSLSPCQLRQVAVNHPCRVWKLWSWYIFSAFHWVLWKSDVVQE